MQRALIQDPGHPPDPIVFTTEAECPAHRLDAWNAAFGSLNAISAPAETVTQSGTRSENWLLGGGMVLSRTRVSNARFVRDMARTRRDGLDHRVIRVMKEGSGRLRHRSFDTVTKAGDLVQFSMHETWEVEWEEAEWVSLCIPRDLDLRLSSGLGALRPGLQRGAGAGLLGDVLLALPGRLSSARAEEVPSLAGAALAAVGACLLAGQHGQPFGLLSDATELTRERVRRAILRNIASSCLTPAQIAKAAGVSRSALYRMYEAEGGVARYIQKIRLSLAYAALRDPANASHSISAIAEAHGFPVHSDFSRAFRSAFGVAPSEVRNVGLSGPAVPSLLRPERSGHRPRIERDYATAIYSAKQLSWTSNPD